MPYPSHGAQCQKLLTIAKDAFLSQMVDEPTRITETNSNIFLDLFLTNNDILVNQTRVIPGISEHEAVFIESSLRPIKKSPSPRRVYKYHRADYDGFKREFRELAGNISEQASELDLQTIWTSFKTTIHRLVEKYIPHKTVRGDRKPKPWITRTSKALHRKRNKLFRKQRSTRKSKDVENYKKIKSKIQRAERQAYWQHVEKVIDLGDSDIEDKPGKQTRFWSFIKSLRKDNSGVAPLKDRGKMHADPVDKSNILNRQYESVYTREDDGDIPCLDGQPYPSMPDIKVTGGQMHSQTIEMGIP